MPTLILHLLPPVSRFAACFLYAQDSTANDETELAVGRRYFPPIGRTETPGRGAMTGKGSMPRATCLNRPELASEFPLHYAAIALTGRAHDESYARFSS